MKSIVAVALLVVVLATALVAYEIRQQPQPASRPQPTGGQPLPFKTIYLFGGSAAGNLVINDNTAWLRVYAEVICGLGDDCIPAASVNFASSTVLAVFAGWRPTAGYEVNITQVRVENSVILVKTILTAPGPTCLVAQMITQPGHVVTIPKTELPVTFETEPTQYSC